MITGTVLAMLVALNQILNAGNTITAFSLLLYALTFNLKERIAQAFAFIMGCVTIVYFGDVLVSTSYQLVQIDLWLRMQWIGIGLLPVGYLFLSDSILMKLGEPKDRIRTMYNFVALLIAFVAIILVGATDLVAGKVIDVGDALFLQSGQYFPLFLFYLAVCSAIVIYQFYLAYKRCRTRTSRRRMRYLFLGSIGPVIGVFPFMMIQSSIAFNHPGLFWFVMTMITIMVAILLVVMSYSIAYYGISIPDRVLKSRLSQWILRGPIVASTILAVSVVTNRISTILGVNPAQSVPFIIVGTILLLQFFITLVRPSLDNRLFIGRDRNDLRRLQLLEERMVTSSDMSQFLEAILDAACDISNSYAGFLAVNSEKGLEIAIAVGGEQTIKAIDTFPRKLPADAGEEITGLGMIYIWNDFWLLPVYSEHLPEIIGLVGLLSAETRPKFTEDEAQSLRVLLERIQVSLRDRQLQQEVFHAVDRLIPRMDAIQEMRAVASYAGAQAFVHEKPMLNNQPDLVKVVKDALVHYWGGPRLTNSPLLELNIVQQAAETRDDNSINGLRAILRKGIDRTRPEGERRFTGEWLLYNILEMKFIEGRKVRDIAMRLSVSEADLYRKQRVAINTVALAIADMETETMDGGKDQLFIE